MKKLSMIILFSLVPMMIFAQNYLCKGIVLGTDGIPLPGVTIVEEETTNYANTDIDGKFQIEVKNKNSRIKFSFMGMVNQYFVANQLPDKIILEEDVMALEEVVVTAYGQSTKSTYTGSAAVVGKKQMEDLKVTSVSQILQGASSGVQVINGGGQPGSDATVRIRGISSINGVSSPLYVVDGVPYGAFLNAINPKDIESITVLKDAAATALYGSRAANGVISITTKKGSEGKPTFSLDVNFGMTQLAVPMPEMINPTDYHLLAWEAIRNGYVENGELDYAAGLHASEELYNYLRVQSFNTRMPVGPDGNLVEGAQYLWPENSWQNALFSNKLRTEVNANVGGSSKNTNYYMSLGYLDDKGALTVSEFERFTGRVNVSTKVANFLDLGMSASYSHQIQDYPDQSRVIRFVNEVPDIYPIYEWDYDAGTYKTDGNGERILDFGKYRPNTAWPNANPLGEAKYDQLYHTQDNVVGRVNAAVNLPYGFKISSNFGIDYSVNSSYLYNNNKYGWSADVNGRSSRSRNQWYSYTFNVLGTWDKYYGKHHISAMVGHEAFSNKGYYLSGSKEGFPLSNMYELNSAAVLISANSASDKLNMEAWISKLDYDYGDRYYVSANFRRDGSSRFSPQHRWGNFWSVSASWRLSNESFMKGADWLDNLKIRASYGTQGNDNIGTYYAYQGVYSSGWNDMVHPGYMVGSLPTPNLTWEKNRQLNVGIDAKFVNRVELSIDYFDRTTKDLLFWRDLPMSSGISSVRDNIGDIRNYGVELQLNTVNILKKNFRWESDLNLSSVKNKVLYLPVDEKINGLFRWEEGRSVYDFYMPEWAGVDPETGDGLFWRDVYESNEAGEFVLDPNGNKKLLGRVKVKDNSLATRYYQGSSLPYLYGGFTNRFYFYGFELSVFLYFSLGGQIYDFTEADRMHSGNIGFNWRSEIADRWTPENKDAKLPRLTTASNNWNGLSTRFLHDASYLRLKNLTFSYNFSDHVLEKIHLKGLKLYFSADNVLTAASHKSDPEAGGVTGQIGNSLNPMRTFSFGLNFSF